AGRRGRLLEAAVVVAGAAGAARRLRLPVVRQRRRRAVALGAVAHVLRVSRLVRLGQARVGAAGQGQLVAHVDLVDEDREIEDGLAVQDRRGAGPGPVGGDGGLGQRRAGVREALLIVVTGGAGADVVADAAVELAGPELARAAADGAEGGV